MEYKIGQIFEIDDVWYQFVEDDRDFCKSCVFYQSKIKCTNPDEDVKCSKWHRVDGRGGHFVRLLPIGDVYEQGGAIWQQYKCVDKPNTEDKRVYISHTDSDIGLIISVRLTENDDLNLIERKIGEIFEHNGEWYQCVVGNFCLIAIYTNPIFLLYNVITILTVLQVKEKDRTSVIFKKLKKVRGSYMLEDKKFQKYRVFHIPYIYHKIDYYSWQSFANPYYVSLESKQNKEDMEENNNAKHSNSENIGKNLKPFNLEAAKSGKPVCTRDGRNARIICFDRNDLYPIVALIECEDGKEMIGAYSKEGCTEIYEIKGTDLMMLPEKKEGWVNLYRDEESKRVYCGEFIFSEREKAEKHYECNDTKVATVSIGWEE